MRVGQRLFLAVLPAIVGLLAVAALAYWGEYSRQAPEWLVVTSIVAATGSAVLAWRNTRYVAQRVEQLAARRGGSVRGEPSGAFRRASEMLGTVLHPQASRDDDMDELDRIERLVDRLTDALAQARTAQAAQAEILAQRQREYQTLVAGAVDGAMRQLEEVRLPLHILVDNHFGELNENQEEMLGAARGASEAVDAALLQLRDVVSMDLGTLTLREERVRLPDVIQGLLAPLTLAAGDRGIAIRTDLPPTLPVLVADRGRLQEAMSVILQAALQQVHDAGTMHIDAEHDRREVRLTVRSAVGSGVGSGVAPNDAAMALAIRLIRAHGGDVTMDAGTAVVHLPLASAAALPQVEAAG